MRKDGKYRFTLQFSANSEEQIRVGELLEKLGNRKSTIIVSALSDYINAHPELQSGYSKIEVKVAPAFDRSQMERLIRSMELPLKRRQVMELLFLEDLSEAETAKRLNCSLQYVRNQRCIALKRLRSRLMEGGDDE